MNTTEKFTLSESLSKGSKNENMSLTLNISGNKLILPESSIDTVIDAYDIYLNERANSNKFRLTVSINPYCSNVLFNPFTEIIKHYKIGDSYRIWQIPHGEINEGITTNKLIEEGIIDENAVIGKKMNINGVSNGGEFVWNTYKAIRDTQFSNNKCGFEYLCGVDIFNNHILRNKSYKSVTFSNKSEKKIKNYKEVYCNSYDRCVNGKCETNNPPYSYDIDEYFNTIDDYMRDKNGVIVSDELPVLRRISSHSKSHVDVPCPLHLYQRFDAETYNKTVKEKLIEENGWFGFKNKSLIDTVSIENYSDKENDINLTINNKKYGEFIDMYPTRDLFTFSPLYNKYKQRLEKNWNYYLTYPSESVTEMLNEKEFPFFHKIISENDTTTTALKVLMIDEYTVLDNGRSVVTIYTICQHGLTIGDRINLYVNRNNSCSQYKITNNKPIECEGTTGVKFTATKVSNNQEVETLFYKEAEVVNVLDKFTFQIYKTEGNISNKWIDLNETEIPTSLLDSRIISYTNGGYALTDGQKKYPIAGSNRCNVDDSIDAISFKRVSNHVECEYYVRMFSRLPNFKFADSEITDETLYGESSKELDLINRYSTSEFENHISDESFARTSYGDMNTEIVFTDDIDISFLRDNIGRPLSDIYITIVKNNEGYKNWYGINNTSVDINVDTIEQSRCFGKNNSSFQLSDYYRETIVKGEGNPDFNDVRDIAIKRRGLLYKKDETIDDEIDKNTLKYYGDICCYSPIDCDEQSIQTVHNRFNTVQRELSTYDDKSTSFYDDNGSLYYDEVQDDENGLIAFNGNSESDSINFYTMFNKQEGDILSNNIRRHSNYTSYLIDGKNMDFYENLTKQTEGYYYKTHYKIKLKTISKTLNIDEPTKYEIYKIYNDGNILNIKTVYSNGFEKNDKLILYVKSKNIFYYLTVKEVITDKYFTCTVQDEKYAECTADSNYISDIENISLLKKSDYVPYYAKIIKDGSCRFYWRNVLANGIEEDDSKIYPFANGAFYINKNINFYLKRQDPLKSTTYSTIKFDYVPKGDIINWYDAEEESYYEADEIEECNIDLKELLK